MGNQPSTTTSDIENHPVKLAMMAVARNCELERVQILALKDAMAAFSDEGGMINRKGFDLALDLAGLSSVEIFDLLFTMWDNAGDERVPFKEFCTGIAPLACAYDELPTILWFSFRVYDDKNQGSVNEHGLRTVLCGINSTASFFGDSHLSSEEISAVIEAIFDFGHPEVGQEDCVRRLSSNPYVRRFASGKGRLRVQFKNDLVTEFVYDQENNHVESPSRFMHNRFLRRGRLWSNNNMKTEETHQDVASLLDSSSVSWDDSTYTADGDFSNLTTPVKKAISPQLSQLPNFTKGNRRRPLFAVQRLARRIGSNDINSKKG